jgi:hypothetical protein
MAITEGTLLEIALKMRFNDGLLMNVYGYEVTGTFTGIPAVNVGEAWWNAIKATQRALIRPSEGLQFRSIVVTEMNNPSGEFAEWNIPSGERQGTRSGVDSSEFLPPFNAAGFRLTVATRATRPGQKRIPGLLEVDSETGALSVAYTALLESFASVVDGPLTLASPALGMDLQPVVFRKDVTGAVVAHQNVVGHVLNPYVTSQVSRKIGRGA